tara:strand:+ start:743 stop:931 length:189 start_codon:yes stop_codon:yes gene_type:complete
MIINKKTVDIIYYLPLKKGNVRQAGALNFILNLSLEIITKTIIVAKYGAITKNCAGILTPNP